MKTKISILILALLPASLFSQTLPYLNAPIVTSDGSSYHQFELDSTTLTDGIKLGNYAKSDGSNITPSVWRSLLDVLTSGQIEALLEGYVQTVGGVGPDSEGDVSKIPSATLKMDTTLTSSSDGEWYLWATSSSSNSDGSGMINRKLRSSALGNNLWEVVQRHVGGVVTGPSVSAIESYNFEDTNRSALISRQWAAAYVPTLQQTPAQDTVEQFVYPRAKIPEIGNGDKSWEYLPKIPASDIDIGSTERNQMYNRIPVFDPDDGSYLGYHVPTSHSISNRLIIRDPNQRAFIGNPVRGDWDGTGIVNVRWMDSQVPSLGSTPTPHETDEITYLPTFTVPEEDGGDSTKGWVNIEDLAQSDDSRFLTTAQKAAAAGTSGSPSDTNRYVTDDDTSVAATAGSVVRRDANGSIELLGDDFSSNSGLIQSGDGIAGLRQTGEGPTGLQQLGDYSYGLIQGGANSTGLRQYGTGSTPFDFDGPDAANIARRGREALGVQDYDIFNLSWDEVDDFIYEVYISVGDSAIFEAANPLVIIPPPPVGANTAVIAVNGEPQIGKVVTFVVTPGGPIPVSLSGGTMNVIGSAVLSEDVSDGTYKARLVFIGADNWVRL